MRFTTLVYGLILVGLLAACARPYPKTMPPASPTLPGSATLSNTIPAESANSLDCQLKGIEEAIKTRSEDKEYTVTCAAELLPASGNIGIVCCGNRR